MKAKKAEIGIGIIFLVAIIIFFIGWLINVNQRECRTNKDCGSTSYCGSDFACHEYPVIQQTFVQYNFLLPSLIIGIAIVFAALVYKWSKQSTNEELNKVEEPKQVASQPEEVAEISEPYYKSESKLRTP